MTDINNTPAWWATDYAARYYAYPNTASLLGGYPTPGYVDMDMFAGFPSWIPKTATLVPLTADEWGVRSASVNQIIKDGSVQNYTPPVVATPLKTQAITALAWVQQQANLAAAMGEVFTADMKAYVVAINAIAGGTDTTSTALPVQPTDVMTASGTTGNSTTASTTASATASATGTGTG